MRVRVVIIMRQIQHWSKPSPHINLTVGLKKLCFVVLPDTVEFTRKECGRRKGAQKCQVVHVDVVPVAQRYGKPANFNMVECFYKPTLNHESGEVCALC